MSKSVSLENLSNNQAEDQLVNEILNEINNNNKEQLATEYMQTHSEHEPGPEPMNEPEPQLASQPEPAPAPEPEPALELEESKPEMNVEEIINQPTVETFQNNTSQASVDHKKNGLVNKLKSSFAVGLFVVLFSLPITGNLLLKMLPAKEFITNNTTVFTSLLKFLLAVVLYFALEQVW